MNKSRMEVKYEVSDKQLAFVAILLMLWVWYARTPHTPLSSHLSVMPKPKGKAHVEQKLAG